MSGLTLGHLLYAMAAFEVVAVSLMALNVLRSNPDARPASIYLIVGAAIVAAIVLAGIATFSEIGRMEIGAAPSPGAPA
jgi:hypothetical protein